MLAGAIGVRAEFASAADWKKGFTSKEVSERTATYDALKIAEGEARTEGITTLREIYDKDLSTYHKAVASLRNLFPGYGKSGGEEKLQGILDTWLNARKAAWEIIFDEQAFPHPGMGAVNGPHTGYDKVMQKWPAAQNTFKAVQGIYLKGLKKAFGGWVEKALAKVDGASALCAERSAILVELGNLDTPFAEANVNVFRAINHLANDEYTEAVKLYNSGGFSNVEKIVYFFFHSEAINLWNDRNPCGHSTGEVAGLRQLNELRMSMGVLPYEAHESLAKAIDGHLKYCGRAGWGHFQNDPAMKTAQQRCEKEGYPGSVSENLATGGWGGGISMWKWDGGHFRNMLIPSYTQCGVGQGPGAGFNNGFGAPHQVPRITPPWSY
jgi:hypothetical protein